MKQLMLLTAFALVAVGCGSSHSEGAATTPMPAGSVPPGVGTPDTAAGGGTTSAPTTGAAPTQPSGTLPPGIGGAPTNSGTTSGR